MKRTILYLLALTFIWSCGKDEVEITHVPSWLQQMLPYQDGQTIKFANANGGLVTATAFKSSHISEQSPCQNCPATKKIEIINCDFKVGNKRFIELAIDNRPNVFMTIWSPENNYQTGSGLDFLTVDGSAQFICPGPRQNCIGSYTLNGTTYNNVLEIVNGGPNPPADLVYKAYYTIDKGLVGFQYGNGLLYYLVP